MNRPCYTCSYLPNELEKFCALVYSKEVFAKSLENALVNWNRKKKEKEKMEKKRGEVEGSPRGEC